MKLLWRVIIVCTVYIWSAYALTPHELTRQVYHIEAAIADLESEQSNNGSRATLELALDVLRAKLADIRALLLNIAVPDFAGIESSLIILESIVDLAGDACSPMPITQEGSAPAPIPITGSVTIDSPGNYCLAEDLNVSSGTAAITIASNDVFLDLNGKRVSNTGTTTAGILIDSFNNVVITNGTIANFTIGINCLASSSTSNCSFIGCRILYASATGIYMEACSAMTIDSCEVVRSPFGIYSLGSTQLLINNCVVSGNLGESTVRGILLQAGSNNLIKNCIVEGVLGFSQNSSDSVAGIMLLDSESCSKVINCTVDSVTTPTSGFSPGYGINVQTFTGSIDPITTATIARPVTVRSIAWQPNSRYLAVATVTSVGGTELSVYELTGVNAFVLLPGADIELATTVNSIAWSPDGQFLAVGSDLVLGQIKIYSFAGQTLTLVTTVNGGADVNSVAWSPDGNYLAAGVNSGGAFDEIQVYAFTGSALTGVAQFSTGGEDILAVDWSPDGQFLAAGSDGSGTDDIAIYQFHGTSLTAVIGGSAELGAQVNSVDWSPHGEFLAIGTQSVISPHVYPVVNGVLGTRIDASTADTIRQVSWSPDGRHLAAAGNVDGTMVFTLTYNGTTFSLVLTDSAAVASEPFSVAWTTDGTILATGGGLVTGYVNGYSAEFSGGVNCVVQDCTVACVEGGLGTSVGISASSDDNLVISNVAFNNDINYVGLVNVYRGGYLGTPTLIQNIAIPPL